LATILGGLFGTIAAFLKTYLQNVQNTDQENKKFNEIKKSLRIVPSTREKVPFFGSKN
jgi:hypothetical protein